MTSIPLLAIGIVMNFVAFLFVVVSIVLILVVLIQKGRGGGLSGAFGGGMASGLLGSKTGDFLTWVTIGLVAVFLGLAVLMARFYRPSIRYGAEAPAPTSQSAPTTTEQPAGGAAGQSGTTAQPPAAQPQPAQPGTTDAGAQPTAGGTGGQ